MQLQTGIVICKYHSNCTRYLVVIVPRKKQNDRLTLNSRTVQASVGIVGTEISKCRQSEILYQLILRLSLRRCIDCMINDEF